MISISEKGDNNSRELSQGLSFAPGKIAERHLQRLAYVYVRQSSPKQVLHHRESQVNQYQLVQRADRLPELWPQLPNSQKKELLRCLISRVILKRESSDTVEVKIVWVSGHYSVVYAQPPIWRQKDVTGYDEIVKKVQALWQEGLDDQAIAARLMQEGYRSARCLEVTRVTVSKVRHKYGWYHPLAQSRGALELDGFHTVRGLATILGVGRNWVYSQMHRGVIKDSEVSRHPQTRMYLIRKNPELIERLRRLRSENCST